MTGTTPRWHIGIETGGTFTDCLAVSPTGDVHRAKVLSSGVIRARVESARGAQVSAAGIPDSRALDLTGFHVRSLRDGVDARPVVAHERDRLTLAPGPALDQGTLIDLATGEPATVLAARLVTGTPAGRPLPPAQVRLATTRATNALLERRITPCVLLVTAGFEDLLEIGDQRRPRLFDLAIRKPAPLHAGVVGVRERLDASGAAIAPIDVAAAVAAARPWLDRGVRAAAIALLHAYREPAHEQALEAALRAIGFSHVSRSSALSRRIRLVPRARTAVINAALSGAIEEFVSSTLAAWAPGACDLSVMTSAGALVPAHAFAPKDSLLSGPAAGAEGAAAIGARAGAARAIAFDMGGTSTDATRIDGRAETAISHRVGDAELISPALAVHSVAAGGGSICGLEVVPRTAGPAIARPVVGPQSAGADPGPACYGRGGPLTITDVNLLLGRLDPASFRVPVEVVAARRALQVLRSGAEQAGAAVPPDGALLEGFLALADQRMAGAIRAISVRRGYDVRDYTLVAFGGAGPQHACAIARELGIRRIIIPRDASILSAIGLGAARRREHAERQVLLPLTQIGPGIAELLEPLAREAEQALAGHESGSLPPRRRFTVRLRYVGQDHALDFEWSPGTDLRRSFESRSREVFGHVLPGREIEVESIRAEAEGPAGAVPVGPASGTPARAPGAVRPARMFIAGQWQEVPVVPWSAGGEAGAASAIDGPALILGDATTVVLGPGWRAVATPHADLLLEAVAPAAAPAAATSRSAIAVELLAGRLAGLGESMGELLGRTAISTNVKERLDYSCALLDADARLVISAPHVPVHLGALGVCVRMLRERIAMQPGDVIVTNHPAFGGSHLPDVTLVAPAHDDAGRLIGFAACRAHHAEIGGTRPGSMPPDARCLADEGVVIPPMHLVRAGGPPAWEAIRSALALAPHPSRAIEENLADLGAQLAAVSMGVAGLAAAARDHGSAALAAAMETLVARARAHAQRAIAAATLPPAPFRASIALDDGSVLAVTVARAGEGLATRLRLDFAGSAGVHAGNLNAPLAVIHSAVMYVVRLLISRALGDAAATEVPLSDGLMDGVDLIVPPGMLNPPFLQFGDDPARLPAVAGGNVETSQHVVNLLLGALGLAADSQGTMNNLLFGDASLGYYETIGGGAGAVPGFAGASGVHTHMTNTAITDPEVLEYRYPVRLDRFAIRRDSGGIGRFPGGGGLVREITFLRPLSVSILSSNRARGPRGLAGGGSGAPGAQHVIRADGSTLSLAHADAFDARPGDRLIIQTPGGGGYGTPAP